MQELLFGRKLEKKQGKHANFTHKTPELEMNPKPFCHHAVVNTVTNPWIIASVRFELLSHLWR